MKRLDILITIEDDQKGNVNGKIQIDGNSNASMLAMAVMHLHKTIAAVTEQYESKGTITTEEDWKNDGKKSN